MRNVAGDVLGREKVREWLPFEAVARGACIFAGGAHVEDFIYHDYALRVLPDDDDEAEYELLIPGGTSFPTADNFVTRYYAPRLRWPATHQPLHLRGRASRRASGRLDRARQRLPLFRAGDHGRTGVLPVPQRGGPGVAAQPGRQGSGTPAARNLLCGREPLAVRYRARPAPEDRPEGQAPGGTTFDERRRCNERWGVRRMSLLKALFGPSQKEIWRQLSSEVGGHFHEGGFLSTSAVQGRADDWIITLDTYTQSTGNTHQTYTRLRAPYFNPEGFRFEIYRASVFSGLGKALGMEDIEVGHPRFDQDFVIKGNAPRRVRRLFDNEKIRHLIDAQPRIHLSVKGHDGWFGKFPAGRGRAPLPVGRGHQGSRAAPHPVRPLHRGPAAGLSRGKGV